MFMLHPHHTAASLRSGPDADEQLRSSRFCSRLIGVEINNFRSFSTAARLACVALLLLLQQPAVNALRDQAHHSSTSSPVAFGGNKPLIRQQRSSALPRPALCHLRGSKSSKEPVDRPSRALGAAEKRGLRLLLGKEPTPPKKAEPSVQIKSSRRHGRRRRVLGDFIKRQLVEADGKPTDLGSFLSENAFDNSVNVVDVTLAKFTTQAALLADRSFMQIFPGSLNRSVFMTGNSKHASQAAWAAFSDVYTGLLLPLKHAFLGGLHPLAIAVGSIIASQHATQDWMAVLKNVLAQH